MRIILVDSCRGRERRWVVETSETTDRAVAGAVRSGLGLLAVALVLERLGG